MDDNHNPSSSIIIHVKSSKVERFMEIQVVKVVGTKVDVAQTM